MSNDQPAGTPAKKHHRVRWTLLTLVALFIILAIIGGGSDDKDKTSDKVADTATTTRASDQGTTATTAAHTETDDVAITTCEETPGIGWTTVKGTATNSSSKRSDYMIDIAIEDAEGTQLESTFAMAQNVEPGQKALWEAQSTTDWQDGLTCRVVDVERNAST